MDAINVIGLNHFDAGAEGAASGAEGSGLSGDFEADFAKNFGKAAPPAVKRAQVVEADDAVDEAQAVDATEEDAEQDAAATGQENGQEDLESEFEKLIAKDGKYREQYNKRTQDIIRQRFKADKTKEAQETQRKESMLPLYKKYGVAVGDDEALSKAVAEDNKLIEERAFKNGLTVEAQKTADKAEYVLEQQKAQQAEQQKVADNQRAIQALEAQAQELRSEYPEFDLRSEIVSNPEFAELIDKGIKVKQAYLAANHDKLMSNAMAYTAERAAKKTLAGVQAQRGRVSENGTTQAAGSVSKTDVGSMSDNDVMDILKRVGRGEKISF